MKFKVGDMLICGCGDKDCIPFRVTSTTSISRDGFLTGIDINGDEALYAIPEEGLLLRRLTPLEKLI